MKKSLDSKESDFIDKCAVTVSLGCAFSSALCGKKLRLDQCAKSA